MNDAPSISLDRRSEPDSGMVIEAAIDLRDSAFINPLEWMPPGLDMSSFSPFGARPRPSYTNDRKDGIDYPYLVTEHDIACARGLARWLEVYNCPTQAIKQMLVNYVIGDGSTIAIDCDEKRSLPGFEECVQDVVAAIDESNDLCRGLDHHYYWAPHRDGDLFVALYPDMVRERFRDGFIKLRTIEPEQVVDPGPDAFSDDFLAAKLGYVPDETVFSLGIHRSARDCLERYGYAVDWFDGEYSYIPEKYMVHVRNGLEPNLVRGRSSFMASWKWLTKQSRLLENTVEGAIEQAAIAYAIQHEGKSESQISAMRRGYADQIFTHPSGRQQYKSFKPAGSILDLPDNATYISGPTGSERGNAFLSIIQGCLRQAAAAFCLPEGAISGDDSNNNYASSKEGGTRFWKFATTQQGKFANWMEKLVWKCLRIIFDAGYFDRFHIPTWRAFKRLVSVTVSLPDVDVRDPNQMSSKVLGELNAKVVDMRTAREILGHDHEKIEERLKEQPPEQDSQGQPKQPASQKQSGESPVMR